VETLNKYKTWNASFPNLPFGIIRIRAEGASRVLKTIIVKYKRVKKHELTAIVHVNSGLQFMPEKVNGWLERVTNDWFLEDSYPARASIRKRYEDVEDVNCPVALVLKGPIETFNGNDVQNGAGAARFNRIQSDDEYLRLTENRDHKYIWSNMDKKAGFDLIIIADLGGYAYAASTPGWKERHGHIWIDAWEDGPPWESALAHEYGHYKGGFWDLYICTECRKIPIECYHFARDPRWMHWTNPAIHPYNFMAIGLAVLDTQRTVLVQELLSQ